MMSELIKVIVADNNKVERNAICNLITKSGLPLMLADSFSNGEDALLYIENNNVDIIVSDIQMPQLTGIELIKELNKKNSNTKVIFISCYDDFSYEKDAIENNASDYVLKPIDKNLFFKALSKTCDSILEEKETISKLKASEETLKFAKEQFFRDLIFSHNENPKTDIFSEDEEKEYKTVVVIDIGEAISINKDNKLYASYAIPTMKEAFYEVSKENTQCYPITLTADSIAVVFMSDNDNNDIESILSELYNETAQNIGVNMMCGISSKSRYLSDLHKLYNEAKEALLYTDRNSSDYMSKYSEITIFDNHKINMVEILKNTKDFIINKKTESAREFINNYLSCSELSNKEYNKNFAYCLTNAIEIVLMEKNKSLEELTGYSIWKKLSKFNTIVNLREWLYNMIIASIDVFHNNIETSTNKDMIVEKIKSFIEKKYGEKITVNSIADELHFSAKYIAMIFSQKENKSIFEYLTEYRIKKAKELLLKPDSKIYVVAEQVGYKRKSHFYDVFKGYVGISPSEYKQQYALPNDITDKIE